MAEGTADVGTPFQTWLGLHWSMADNDTGALAVEMDIRDDLRGPAGSLEGGVISTLADVAGASAIAMKVGMVATEHMSVSFLAPGRLGPVRATATPLRISTHDGVAEVRVVDTGHDNRLIAVAIVTVRLLNEHSR
jgi:acyl-CoA thioesterase